MEENKRFFRSKKVWFLVGTVVLLIIACRLAYVYGYKNGKEKAQARVDQQLVTYNKLLDLYEKKKSDYHHLANQYDQKKVVFDQAKALVDQKDQLTQQISDSKETISSLEEKAKNLNAEIDNKQSELDKITGEIKVKKEAPIFLNSGQYIVGKDIPAGRYRATNIGEGSNFFVYDESGEAVVNTILGDPSTGGTGDYVFFCDDGNIIQTEARVKLIPVE